MKYFLSVLASIGIALIAVPTVSLAQPTRVFQCEARSQFAIGIGTASVKQVACNRALYECSIRTPVGYTCYVTRFWLF